MTKNKSVAYGSIYLDLGDNIHQVEEQINSFALNIPVAVFFDVLGKENDRLLGEKLVTEIKDLISTKMPYLKESDISCSFSVQ